MRGKKCTMFETREKCVQWIRGEMYHLKDCISHTRSAVDEREKKCVQWMRGKSILLKGLHL